MCGIVGYLDKTGTDSAQTGARVLKMLGALGRRGPDSAGAALYAPRADEALVARIKLGDHGDFDGRAAEVIRRTGALAALQAQAQDREYLRLVLGYEGDPRQLQAAIEDVHPQIEVLSLGTALEIVKQVGSPLALDRRFGLAQAPATHAIAHTRLSTESKIDLSHSQPFWAHGALDLATVHNGHITNYHKLRRQYEQRDRPVPGRKAGGRAFAGTGAAQLGVLLRRLILLPGGHGRRDRLRQGRLWAQAADRGRVGAMRGPGHRRGRPAGGPGPGPVHVGAASRLGQMLAGAGPPGGRPRRGRG
jgi:hypothetical protein